MNEEEKPFIWYKKGKWSFEIVPRNAAGWRATAAWVLALTPIVSIFIWAISRVETDVLRTLTIFLYIAAMFGWVVAMVRWMKPRCEIVDLQELLQIKREKDAERRRPKR
jgi:hypothetical protein